MSLRRAGILAGCALISSVLVAGCSACGGDKTGDDRVVARVGEQSITKAQLDLQLQITGTPLQKNAPPAPVPPRFTACIENIQAQSRQAQKTSKDAVMGIPDKGLSRRFCQDAYKVASSQALSQLILDRWIAIAAQRLRITADAPAVSRTAKRVMRSAFPSEGQAEAFAERAGVTNEQLEDSFEGRALLTIVVNQLAKRAPQPDKKSIETYLQQNPEFGRAQDLRDVEFVVTDSLPRAREVRAKIQAGGSFQLLSDSYSVPRYKQNQGSLQDATVDTPGDEVFGRAIFRARPAYLVGPIKVQSGWAVFQVRSVTPKEKVAKELPLEELAANVVRSEKAFSERRATSVRLERSLRAETTCAPGYTAPECRNYKPIRSLQGLDITPKSFVSGTLLGAGELPSSSTQRGQSEGNQQPLPSGATR